MDLQAIDLNLLVAFEALIAERSVTRAGMRVGRSQPAMSAALARLRELLGDELLIRSPKGLQPTARAMELAEPVGSALAEIRRALSLEQKFDPRRSTVTFTIALSEHPAFAVLPRLLEHLGEVAPAVTVRVRGFTARDDAVVLLDDGEADVAIGVPPTSACDRILTMRLWEERFACIVRRGHPVAERALDLEAYLELDHLLVSPEDERYGRVDEALAPLGLKRRLKLTLPQMYAAPPLVARTDMIATLMAGVIDGSALAEALVRLDLPIQLAPVPFVMMWHRRNHEHVAQRWLRDMLALCTPAVR